MKNLKRIREKAGKTQEDISSFLNIDRSSVAKWESGVSFPRSDKLSQLAKILDCTVDDLVCNTKENDVLLNNDKHVLIPMPKVSGKNNEIFSIPTTLKITTKSPLTKLAINNMNELFKEIYIKVEESDENSHIIFEKISADCAEYYRLFITKSKIIIRFCDELGARNAVMSLFNLIEHNADSYCIPCCSIVDWPNCEFRGLMLDLARMNMPIDQIFSSIKQMALSKMNYLMIHISDTHGFAFKSDKYPNLSNCKIQQYTKEEMRSIIDCCKFWGIEAIPDIDLPAHANNIFANIPEARCKVEDGSVVSDWAVCAGNDFTYKLIEDLFTEAFEMFNSKYACTWGDELEFLDLTFVDCWLNWSNCSECSAIMKKEGYKNQYELYYWFVRKVNNILKKMGKTLIVGNDSIDINSNPDIPKDVIIAWWRVAGEKRGFHLGQSLDKFIKAGYKVLNVNYPDTYIDLYINEEKLADWTPVKRPEIPEEFQSSVLGSYMCAWDDKKHYRWTLPSAIVMFGDKLWNYENREYNKEYKIALTKTILGPKTPAGFDLFTGLGGCILPQEMDSSRMGFPEKLNINDIPYIDNCINILELLIDEKTVNEEYCKAYIECLNWVKEKIEK